MIPPRMRTLLYIIFTFLFLLSCQKKECKVAKHKNTKAEVEKLIVIANKLFYNNNKLDSAFYYYNKAKFICNPVTDADNYLAALNSMAEIQQIHGDYAGSETTITEGLPYLKYVKKIPQIWNSYVTLSINYLNTYDYKNAILYNRKALQLKNRRMEKISSKK